MKKNTKHIATISLGIMGAGFAASFPFAHLPAGFVLQSGFEAGVVGGLADWFAVTALFRHPLGIPIPHTALLPRNREKVTNALVNAIQTNLLTKESIIDKMKSFGIAERLVDKAKEELEREVAGERVSKLFGTVFDQLSSAQIAAALAPSVREWVRNADVSPALEKMSRIALERGLEEPLFDYILDVGERFVTKEETRIRMGAMALRSMERLQLGGFMGFAVNAFAGFMSEDKLGGMLQEFILTMLADMRKPGNEYREAALVSVRETVGGISANRWLLSEIDKLKTQWLERDDWNEEFETAVGKWWNRMVERLTDPVYCQRKIVPCLDKWVGKIKDRPEWTDRLNRWIRHRTAELVERNHGVIGQLVKENANKLDNEQLIAMMEEHVGKDLQWIRVNGAVCGFVIGIGLGILQWVVSGA